MLRIYREFNRKLIKGIGLPAFIHNGDYHSTVIEVYEDGLICCWDNVDFEGFVGKVRSGRVTTQVPVGGAIVRFHLFSGLSEGVRTYVKEEEFIKEVRDTIDELQGKSTSSERCRKAFSAFLKSPEASARENLKTQYERVPEHLKKYTLGDMDAKDGDIKSIIAGGELGKEQLDYLRKHYLQG